MLDAVLSSFAFVSMSYRESRVEEVCLGVLGSFSGKVLPLVGSTMSKNPSITKKSPKTISVLVRTDETQTHLYRALQPLPSKILRKRIEFRLRCQVHSYFCML
jgi:hypothetical protein